LAEEHRLAETQRYSAKLVVKVWLSWFSVFLMTMLEKLPSAAEGRRMGKGISAASKAK